jgi:hypothetical protein
MPDAYDLHDPGLELLCIASESRDDERDPLAP